MDTEQPEETNNSAVPRSPGHQTVQTEPGASDINDINDEKEKASLCLPKGIIFVFVLLALVGAIIGVTLYMKNDPSPKQTALGQVIPNDITHSECVANVLPLNATIVITCIFDIEHEYRKELKQADTVVVDSPVQPNDTSFTDTNDDSRVWTITGPRARCTSRGIYRLNFYAAQKVVHRASVLLRLNEGAISATLNQRMISNDGTTVFDVTCSTTGSCYNYDVDFVGKSVSYAGFDYLNERKVCTSSYNDIEGRTISCTTQLDEDTVDTYRQFIGCRVKDGNIVGQKQLVLPSCLTTLECNFNCSTKSNERKSLDSGICGHHKITRCFPAERPVFRQQVCPPEGDCDIYIEEYQCIMGWCRSRTGVIYKNELAGEILCPDFNAKQPRTPEITTPETTTPTTTTTTTTPTTTTPTSTTTTPTSTTTTIPTTTTTTTTTTTPSPTTSSQNTPEPPR